MYSSKNVICTDLSTSHHLVHSTNLPSTAEVYAAVDDRHKLIHRQGAILRVPQSTLQKPKQQGGWALISIAVKFRALLLRRMWVQSKKGGAVTATWLKTWDFVWQQGNRPYAGRIPYRIAYLRYYALDMAYVAPPRPDEAPAQFKRRVYDTLHKMELATRRTVEMRVVQKSPNTDWDRVWRNLHASCL
jgi:hypothetical protein